MTEHLPTPNGAKPTVSIPNGANTVRRELLIGGYDPATPGGKLAFIRLTPRAQARYLHRIEYLEADVSALLGLLSEAERAGVLAFQDDQGCWRD